jgi:antitoxin (DNA-binding transcriptional repressor) of toxin-antitoxin stability system
VSVYSIAKAKDNFSKLVDDALAGEDVAITRRGNVVACLARRSSAQFGGLPIGLSRKSWRAPRSARGSKSRPRTSFVGCGTIYREDLFRRVCSRIDCHGRCAFSKGRPLVRGLRASVIISDLAALEVSAVIPREFRARRYTRA